MSDLKAYLASLWPSLQEEELEALSRFSTLLEEANRHISLTAIREPQDSAIKHFWDSLAFHKALELQGGESLLDLGSGPGFPGMVLAIMNPHSTFTLVDSVGKKTAFLQETSRSLGLKNVTVLQGRAEGLGQDPRYREAFDVAVARSVAWLPTLSEYLLPFLREGGVMAVSKEAPWKEEAAASQRAIDLLGGAFLKALPYELPLYGNQRGFLFYRKVKKTPKAYPRREGIPLKRPLS